MKFSDYHKQKWPGPLSAVMLGMRNALFPSKRHSGVRAAIAAMSLDKVAAGPFRGTIYGPDSGDGAILPRLLGTYEKEVYDAVEAIVASDPDVVAIAGAGEGYFAIGLARRLPKARIIGFEASRWSRYLLNKYSKMNDVQVELQGWCTPDALRKVLRESNRPAIVCDIEGGEREVLDPSVVPELSNARILVELHPMYVDGIEETLVSRFVATHDLERMTLQARTAEDAPHGLRGIVPDDELVRFIDEFPVRGSGTWLYLAPKNPTN